MKTLRLAALATLFFSLPPEAPAQTTALPSQPIGPGDLIQIQVLNFPEFTRALRVTSDGTVGLPLLREPLTVRGKLPVEVESQLRDLLRSEELVVNPSVSVTVVEYASRPISVIGAVKNPLIFQAVGRVTLSDAIIRAGGFSPEAGPELLLTANGTTRHILVRDLLQSDTNEANLLLTGHEEIRVPPAGRLYVLGDVRTPGSYPVLDRTDTTILKAISLSGGLSPSHSKEIYVIRRDEVSGTKHQIPINLHAILHLQAADYPLLPDDILYIPDNRARRDTLAILDRIVTFGTAIGTGVIVYTAAK